METKAEKQLKHLKPIRKNGERVKKVFEIVANNIKEGKPAHVSTAMREVGFSPSSCRALNVQKTETWQQLLDASLPDDDVIRVLMDLVSPVNEDKRSRLDAAKEVLKLKNKYPAEKKNFNIVKAELEDLFINDENVEDDRRTETTGED